MKTNILPPFTNETALLKVQELERLWNSKDLTMMMRPYASDVKWCYDSQATKPRQAVKKILADGWLRASDYKITFDLWVYSEIENLIAVHFDYAYKLAPNDEWTYIHGLEYWEFDEEGLIKYCHVTNDEECLEKSHKWAFWLGVNEYNDGYAL